MTKAHVLKAPMTRRQREDLADGVARSLADGVDLVFTITTVDARYVAIPATGLDLVVRAPTPESAFVAWERHADALGAEGVHRVCLTYTHPERDGVRQPERETIRKIDLDWLLLCDTLEPFDDEDEALGLSVDRC